MSAARRTAALVVLLLLGALVPAQAQAQAQAQAPSRPEATSRVLLQLDTAFTDLERDASGRAVVRLAHPGGSHGTDVWLGDGMDYVQAFTGDTLAEPVIVTDFLNVPGKPDGMALAPDGSFRVAMWGGGCVAHIAADGATLGWTDVPAPHVSSACFAGADRLLVTTSRMRLSPAALADAPMSGGLFEIKLDRTGSNA